MLDILTNEHDIRRMFVTYDNIIQSTDYAFLQFFLSKRNIFDKIFHLKIFENISKDMKQQYLINRPEKDLLKWLSNGKVTYENCHEYGINTRQLEDFYYNDIMISTFGKNITNLLAKGYIEKLVISVDKENINKLKIIGDIFSEYQNEIKIVDDSDETKQYYFRDIDMDTIVTNDEELLYDNVKYLKNKSIMINHTSYIFDFIKTRIFDEDKTVMVTKNRWEELKDYTISFIKPYTMVKGKPVG